MLPNEEIAVADFQIVAESLQLLGRTVSYYRLGQENAPNLLVVHGMNSNALFIAPLLKALSQHFCVTAPDLPGHGLSAAPESYTLEAYCSFLHAFVQELQLTDFVLFGHSLGGEVSVAYAALHKVKGLVLSSPAGCQLDFGNGARMLRSPIGVLLNRDFVIKSQIKEDFTRFQPELEAVVAEYLERSISMVKTTQREILRNFDFWHQEKSFESVNADAVLLLLAEFDGIIDNKATAKIMESKAKAVWLKTYHEATYQIPRQLTDTILQWAENEHIIQ